MEIREKAEEKSLLGNGQKDRSLSKGLSKSLNNFLCEILKVQNKGTGKI